MNRETMVNSLREFIYMDGRENVSRTLDIVTKGTGFDLTKAIFTIENDSAPLPDIINIYNNLMRFLNNKLVTFVNESSQPDKLDRIQLLATASHYDLEKTSDIIFNNTGSFDEILTIYRSLQLYIEPTRQRMVENMFDYFKGSPQAFSEIYEIAGEAHMKPDEFIAILYGEKTDIIDLEHIYNAWTKHKKLKESQAIENVSQEISHKI